MRTGEKMGFISARNLACSGASSSSGIRLRPEFERRTLLEKVAASCSAARMSAARVRTQVPAPAMAL